ncbi:unnamed protein product [Cladocopium goreaui]|uniref:Uncharacterized protein n=1 Tax=Cladocopium goreaui TaxID=2562237 RepID=A0A9P1D1J4_9DINO|nr:unnamed protein product [Cladocopium goreaui]
MQGTRRSSLTFCAMTCWRTLDTEARATSWKRHCCTALPRTKKALCTSWSSLTLWQSLLKLTLVFSLFELC